jgi:hypothetical protein
VSIEILFWIALGMVWVSILTSGHVIRGYKRICEKYRETCDGWHTMYHELYSAYQLYKDRYEQMVATFGELEGEEEETA